MGMVGYLLQQGANIHAEDCSGRAILHWIANWTGHLPRPRNPISNPPRTIRRDSDRTTFELAIEKGINFNAAGSLGRTPLMYAVRHNRHWAACHLLGANRTIVDTKTKHGRTALHLAIYTGFETMVRLLLERGANVEATTKDGFRPLHIAALLGHEALVQALVQYNADTRAELLWPLSQLEDHADNEDIGVTVVNADFDVEDDHLRGSGRLDNIFRECMRAEVEYTGDERSWTPRQLCRSEGRCDGASLSMMRISKLWDSESALLQTVLLRPRTIAPN